MPSHVFISYHNGDRPYVEKLAAHLITSGFAVWYDFGLAAGQQFPREIERQIDGCAALIVVLTPQAVASDWVNREIGYALTQRKPILPVELRAVPRVGIELVTLHRENVRSGGMPSAAFIDRLREVVGGRDPGPVHDPTTDDQPTDALRAEMRALAGVVFGIRFAKQALGRRGYDEDEVGAFLQQIARQLREGVGTITASDIDYVAFKKPPFGKRGYDEAEVDAFLDHVASAFRRIFPQQPAS